LGLRELGIAAEHGLSSLSIPKRLLRGKGRGENKGSLSFVPYLNVVWNHAYRVSYRANPAEPPPPFPPPPPFVPLNSSKLDDQIGLLKSFFQTRFAALTTLAPAAISLPPPPPPPLLDDNNAVVYPPASVPTIVAPPSAPPVQVG
jgi:transcriptional activator SPT7